MLYSIIKENYYQDSINLMLLTNAINAVEGVNQSQIMMATDANKDLFRAQDLFTEDLNQAGANDMAIVVDTDQADVFDSVLERIDTFLSDLSGSAKDEQKLQASTLKEALEVLPDANMALVSIPGEYAAGEIEKALDKGLHVFSFSDNVSLEDEVRLKKKAHDSGLLLMGPDCGTGIISGIPLAFTNVVNTGNIGIVAASGTGIQEATTIIDRLGGGVVHAIGTGGRDLKDAVEAITMLDAIAALEKHEATEVILAISKPPAKAVRDKVMAVLQSLSKPVVAIFLGEKPSEHVGNVALAYTLEEAAQMAVDLANGQAIKANYHGDLTKHAMGQLPAGKTVKGLYSGGTLANEAATLIADALQLERVSAGSGYILNQNGFQVMDLGDDVYTQGKPHPMIDPEVRLHKLQEVLADPTTGVILLDVVLGYGAHPDMAGVLAAPLQEALKEAKNNKRQLYVIATVVGTDKDPQNYERAVETLTQAGVLVASSNERAVRLAIEVMGHKLAFPDKSFVPYTGDKLPIPDVSPQLMDLLLSPPRVVNIGLASFTDSIETFGGKTVQYDWRPRANGNKRMIRLLDALEKHDEQIEAANAQLVKRFIDSQPFLVDVKRAKELIPELNTDQKVVLHAGPPITFDKMTGPMKGSVIGAMKFEGWAKDDEDALSQLENGEVSFIPCHHVGAVGPMGGITTKNFPMVVVENRVDGTTGYCIMNEGIGEVLRFGANGPSVIKRLEWMRDVLGPVLAKALQSIEGGLNLNVIVARAIAMGDEFHQRNIAASLVFLKEITPAIMNISHDEKEKTEVIQFLADTDQFFLNIMMAMGKSIVDYARKFKEGCIVTTMTRNGENFGIRIGATGDTWFTAPVNTPVGLYFSGYSKEDGNKDIGDSAITETVGVGGLAMIAAPGVTRFIGLSGLEDARRISEEMSKITVTNNPTWPIPNWDFKGTLLGIDIRKVVETGITPIINTGIAHKKAGVGQVGAGTVRAPLACFEKALEAYAKSLGIEI